jgi:hypothetical protein
MIAEALLISAGFGGADADLRGGEANCLSGEAEAVGLGLFISVVGLWVDVAPGAANASSANLSVTL